MAKLDITVALRKDDGTQIGQTINSGQKNTRSECESAIAAVIQTRVDAANGAAADLVAAQNAFNS